MTPIEYCIARVFKGQTPSPEKPVACAPREPAIADAPTGAYTAPPVPPMDPGAPPDPPVTAAESSEGGSAPEMSRRYLGDALYARDMYLPDKRAQREVKPLYSSFPAHLVGDPKEEDRRRVQREADRQVGAVSLARAGVIEAQLVAAAEAEAAARRETHLAMVARCRAEVRHLEARPDDINEPAFGVVIGVEDWRAEMRGVEYHEQMRQKLQERTQGVQ